MKDLIIFPFGGNAREALITIDRLNENNKTWNVLGFVDDDESRHGSVFEGIEVVGGREIFDRFKSAFVLAVPGSPQSYLLRENLINSLKISPERWATIIDPSVVISRSAHIGMNVLVMANVFLSSQVRVGNHCVLLPQSVISHEAVIGDYAMIGSNCSVSGGCKIGRSSYLGSGSRLKENVVIGDRSLIGLGSVVLKNTQPDSVFVGVPARLLHKPI